MDGQEYTQNLRLEPDPVLPPGLIAGDKDEDEEDEMEEMEREERQERVIDD